MIVAAPGPRASGQSSLWISSILYPSGSSRNAITVVPCFIGPAGRTTFAPRAASAYADFEAGATGDGFKALDLGGSAAQSVVLMVLVIGFTVIQFRFVEKKVTY